MIALVESEMPVAAVSKTVKETVPRIWRKFDHSGCARLGGRLTCPKLAGLGLTRRQASRDTRQHHCLWILIPVSSSSPLRVEARTLSMNLSKNWRLAVVAKKTSKSSAWTCPDHSYPATLSTSVMQVWCLINSTL